ncbi:MAG TPA: formylglycine-generating enzyme family protein, partial [Planctomycetota bacterium]|nr:formylglycine-generating enzyme family protein [Planctomycetota bacterium]
MRFNFPIYIARCLLATTGLWCALPITSCQEVAPAKKEVATEAEKPGGTAHKTYVQKIEGTSVEFEMIAIPGGSFAMGSPDGEKGRKSDEGPVQTVRLSPFWMGRHELTWDEYELWSADLDRKRRAGEPSPSDLRADAVTRPTPPYTDMTFGMGDRGFPAICMTQHSAKTYCKWLSEKTGVTYRLPTEAEWEYACRAGTKTAYSFGDDPGLLSDYAWFRGNAKGRYKKVGTRKPNPWGLYDMHGNVAEWCLDAHSEEGYGERAADLLNPWTPNTEPYPHVVRGGSYKQR